MTLVTEWWPWQHHPSRWERTCRWGHAASSVGSSSSGSNSAPVGLEDGGRVRNKFIENWGHKQECELFLIVPVWFSAAGPTHHDDGLGVDGLGHHFAVVSDVLHHLVKSCPLHLLVLEVAERVADEVEQHAALTQLLHEQFLPINGRGIWGRGGEASQSQPQKKKVVGFCHLLGSAMMSHSTI